MVQKKLTAGILAHVDAGKTTLAESILYVSGSIRKLGRVDHGDAFLDTDEMERDRGITIFSKQAKFTWQDTDVTLLDTPGHVDFSAEMERTLQVLDYAILVISGADGVQGHVETLWRLLKRYQVPVFLFINKMDQPGTDRRNLMEELERRLDGNCVDFGAAENFTEDRDAFWERLAMCDEALLEQYLETGELSVEAVREAVAGRKVFPCFFGSALKVQGVEEFLRGFDTYTRMPVYPAQFGAKVFKIARDALNSRLTYMKITGGCLKVKMPLQAADWEEKADQIRIYSGAGFQTVQEAPAGTVCAVTGLSRTYSGQGLGREQASDMPVLEPVLSYRISLPEGCDVHGMYRKLRQLEEEEPQLHILWEEQTGELHAQLMGEVQMEVLKRLIWERFGAEVAFEAGTIVYKETIESAVEGVGHFEPLRHYAEVHLLLEPGEPGSGLQFGSNCSEDVLDKNWQRLVLTHLEEKQHKGVLTGSEITDMRITLIGGAAHQKHTEGGDFRQATYRAVRQGLMQARSILLEPVYGFRLELPGEMVGRALSDIQKMQGSFEPPETEGEYAVIRGRAPVMTMRDYQKEVVAYTRGRGRLACSLAGYEPCHNAAEVIASRGYEPESDLENPAGSVFCAHGAGFVVPWYQVPEYMHLDMGLCLKEQDAEDKERDSVAPQTFRPAQKDRGSGEIWIGQEEIDRILAGTYGAGRGQRRGWKKNGGAKESVYDRPEAYGKPAPAGSRVVQAESGNRVVQAEGGGSVPGSGTRPEDSPEEYLLVDGYNIIFAWEDLRELAAVNIESARNKLMDMLSAYQGYRKMNLILVFDAYKVEGGQGSVTRYHNIHVVFTKEAETADQYIEKTVHRMGRHKRVSVATSDGLEQVIIMGQGARRLSARELRKEMEAATEEIREKYLREPAGGGRYLFEELPDPVRKMLEDVRLGKKEL